MLRMFRVLPAAAMVVTSLAFTTTADAHVGFQSGPAFPLPIAGSRWLGALKLSHSCHNEATGATSDTELATVTIPPEFTGVRPMHSSGGKTDIATDGDGVVTVTWAQDPLDVQEADTHYYLVYVRGRLPETPFAVLEFPTIQTCVDGLKLAWIGEEVPILRVLPPRSPGWNQYTIPEGVSLSSKDVTRYFSDARIVWYGQKGYSSNPETTAQIGRTEGASALITDPTLDTDEVLSAGNVIWVLY